MKYIQNITMNKDNAMKRYPIESRQSRLAGILPVFAAISMSLVSTASAQDVAAAETKGAVPPPPAAGAIKTEAEKDFSVQEKYVMSALAQASAAMEKEAYEDALEIFKVTAAILDYHKQTRLTPITGDLKAKWDSLFVALGAKQYRECQTIIKDIADATKDVPVGQPTKLIVSLTEKYEALRKVCCDAMANKIYQESRDKLINILAEKDLQAAAAQGADIKAKLNVAKFIYYLGVKNAEEQELANAIKASKDPDFAERVDNLIAQCNKIHDYSDFVDKTSLESKDPGLKDRQLQIQQLYRQGEQLYRKRRYTQARDKMEQILILDPYNDKAIQVLSRIYRKLYFIADMRQYNELLQEQSLIEWRWVESVPDTAKTEQDNIVREYEDTNNPLYNKSKNLIIPSIKFEQYTVRQAATELMEKSKQLDPEGIGVNILLMGPKEGEQGAALNLLDSPVTFTLQNVPLLECIRYLCLHAGLKYRIDEQKKVIVLGDAERIAEGNTMDKVEIPIRRATVNRMIGFKIQTSTEDGGKDKEGGFSVEDAMDGMSVEDTFDTGVAAAMATRTKGPDYSTKLRNYFIDLGFSFPEGTTYVAYNPKTNRLEVKNTPEVLRKLELLVREIDIDTPLVLMEAKIMEIAMNDLEELGFDWTLSHQNTNIRWSFGIGSPVRKPLNYEKSVLINNMNILPNFGGDNVWNVFLTVYALDQTDRSEVLSTPKLMTKNGETGTIRMVREMYFPEDWEEPELGTSCGSSITLEPSIPEFGDATDVGVIFTATPVVSPNNYTINISLAPSVVDLVGWSDYSYEIVFGKFGRDANTGSTESGNGGAKVTLKMPELSNRAVETQVKVYDGQTVVIGGMLVDHQARRDDRWPVLGEIPLLGRLFSVDSSNSQKDNLLISVTSRLISGDGNPLRANPAPGLPDFRR